MEPAVAELPPHVYRVGRKRALLRHSEITPADAALPTAGNRFDVPGGQVLYAATERVTCYAETLARFRPTAAIVAALKADPDEHFMAVGGVPRDWRLQRLMGTLSPDVPPAPFLDVEDPATQEYLNNELASELVALGYEGNLTIADVCNDDRRLSRAIAHHAYTSTNDEGAFLYSGVRYCSKVYPDWECWAIFDGTDMHVEHEESIELSDRDLKAVEKMWRLRVF